MRNRRIEMSKKRGQLESSGNVFADLNLPRPEEALAKAELAQKIAEIIRQRRLTQSQAAAILGVDQPKISALRRGRLSGFSLERMVRFLILLGRDVQIVVKSRPRSRSQARLMVA
jgi:predicted XRE-type DNA-binding protein